MPTKRLTVKKSARRPAVAPRRALKTTSPSLRLHLYHVDAFSSRPFHGNPAAVVLLTGKWPADDTLQAIAAENNLPATAFVLGANRIRWFTPTAELEICGHGTLAAAHVLWNHVRFRSPRIKFTSSAGPLTVSRADDLIVLDFPANPARSVPAPRELAAALGRAPSEVFKARDLMAVFDNRRDIYELRPDFEALARIATRGIIVTAPGSGHDFVSRFFAPSIGVREDHVTGSSHCTLIPFWADRLGKKHLTAHQVSRRGGEIFCEHKGSRVLIGGRAVTFMQGEIML